MKYKFAKWGIAAAFAAGLSGSAIAAEPPVPIPLPIIAPSLPIGSEAYNKTAIINVEAGASYIRFANLRDEPTQSYVDIYGQNDRQILGSFVVTVPAKGTVQFQPELMIQTFAPVNWEQPIVLYVENGREKQVWQHIKLRRSGLTNAAVCAAPPHLDYVAPGNAALNLYAGFFARFQSMVTVHNFGEKAGRFEARVYEAATGKKLGSTIIELGARESFTRSGTWYTGIAGLIGPSDDQPYLNVEFVPVEDTGARIVVGHDVNDIFNGTTVNLSNPCPIHGGLVSIF